MSELVRNILIVYGTLSLFAVLLYLPKIFGFRFGFKKPPYKSAREKRKISVIVPARGESDIIGDLFASLEKQTYDREFFDVNVIVKDPDDPTVAMARACGARVFVVSDQHCKGDALDGYFKALSREELASYEAFVIVDADAVLAPDYVSELNNALEHDYDIYITRKFAKNYLGEKKDRSLFSNCSTLTWPIIDDLGNLYRMQKDVPLNLCGQGMMIRRRVAEEIGGWPYRTLTEDYELKLDSLLRGFRSMFYPYAVIYTEEALGHRENCERRVRWLTGYSQCDKKYKDEIKRQARERGRLTNGEREYFFGVTPLVIFALTTFVTIFSGVALASYYAVNGDENWFFASWLLVFMPFCVMYVLLFLFGVLALSSDPEIFRVLSRGEKLGMLLFNPFYLLEYIPLYIKSRHYTRKNRAPAWKQTERIRYGDQNVAERAKESRGEEQKRQNKN